MVDIKWTVSIIFQNADNRDMQFFNSLREDIELQEKQNPGVIKYFVLRHDEDAEQAIPLVINDQSRLEEVKPSYPAKGFYSNWEIPRSIWSKFLKNAIDYPTAAHFVMTYGHGAGYGFSTSRILDDAFRNDDEQNKRFNAFRVLLSHAPFDHTFSDRANKNLIKDIAENIDFKPRGFSLDDLKNGIGIIPVGVFKSAIDEAYKDQKIDLLFFGNCFMQTIENGYLFKDVVRYMAGSEGFYSPTGTDFRRLFQIMATEYDLGLACKKIAQAICDGIPGKTEAPRMKEIYKDDLDKLEEIKNSFSFSVNDLSKYEDLKEAISNLGQQLINASKYSYVNDILRSTREDKRICRDVWETQLLGITDLLRFRKNFELHVKYQSVRSDLDRFLSAKNKIDDLFYDKTNPLIAARYYPYKAFDPTAEGGTSAYPEGISIFFPRQKSQTNEQDQFLNYYIKTFYKDNAFKHPFLDQNKWRDFVINYYYNLV